MTEQFDQAYWDDRYRSRTALWSGNPGPNLVGQVSDLNPGRALDIGCGEGADAIWLSRRGWTVTALDTSVVALERAAGHAVDAGPQVADRISWVHADLREWSPDDACFDLISAQYMHLYPADRDAVFTRLAGAVAPGGSLLVVGHHPSDVENGIPRPPIRELFFTGAEIIPLVDPAQWEVVTDATVPGKAVDHHGRDVVPHDTVLRLRRRE